MALGNMGSGIAKKILVSIDVMTDQAQKRLKSFERRTKRSANSVSKSVTGGVGQAQNKMDQFSASARGVGNASTEAQTGVRGLNSRIATFGKDTKHASTMANGFRMDMLSVMFAGMQLMSVFGGMIGSMMKFTGASSALGAAMKSVLLPVSMVLQPMLIKLSQFLMSLSESEKMLLGVATVGLAVAGAIAFIGAQVVMLAGALSMMSIGIGTVAAVLAGAIALIVGGFMLGMKIGNRFTDEVRFAMDVVGTIIQRFSTESISMFKNFVDIIAEVISFVVNVFTLKWGKAWGNVKTIFTKVVQNIQSILSMFFLTDIASMLAKAAKKILGKARTLGENIIDGIVNGIKSAPGAIMDAIQGIAPDWVVDVLSDAGSAISSGMDMAGSVMNVNDFVMTPNGDVLSYSPSDYIFGTKNPENLAGGGGGGQQNIEVNFQEPRIDSEVDMRELMDEVERRLESDMRRDNTVF